MCSEFNFLFLLSYHESPPPVGGTGWCSWICYGSYVESSWCLGLLTENHGLCWEQPWFCYVPARVLKLIPNTMNCNSCGKGCMLPEDGLSHVTKSRIVDCRQKFQKDSEFTDLFFCSKYPSVQASNMSTLNKLTHPPFLWVLIMILFPLKTLCIFPWLFLGE